MEGTDLKAAPDSLPGDAGEAGSTQPQDKVEEVDLEDAGTERGPKVKFIREDLVEEIPVSSDSSSTTLFRHLSASTPIISLNPLSPFSRHCCRRLPLIGTGTAACLTACLTPPGLDLLQWNPMCSHTHCLASS